MNILMPSGCTEEEISIFAKVSYISFNILTLFICSKKFHCLKLLP